MSPNIDERAQDYFNKRWRHSSVGDIAREQRIDGNIVHLMARFAELETISHRNKYRKMLFWFGFWCIALGLVIGIIIGMFVFFNPK
jgi:pyridoxine/pyridoxamine 5'-phosphate oxidase